MTHNKKMKKFVKKCLTYSMLFGVFAIVLMGSFVGVSLIKFQSIPLQAEALQSPSQTVCIYSQDNRPIKEDIGGKMCKLETLQQHTKEAFISIEDKTFYKHHGLNYKRIAVAMAKNISTLSLREGASTISQQLIKNTHLSGEKTFERKLKEMVLTKKLEKSFSKDDILESYLNIIFFGNNCYGLESASEYYFNKEAKDLSLSESCTLAGMIRSPSKYSPITHYANCLKRRNLVLSEMQKDGYISVEEQLQAQNSPINLDVKQKKSNLNTYAHASIDEASKILNLPIKQIVNGGYKIHTYLNLDKQASLEYSLQEVENCDNLAIVIDAKTCGVCAYHGNSIYKLLDVKRQPASCIKPLLVYTPAFNENVVSPETQILDEEIKIGNYVPSNVNKKFSGYVSVTDAVKNSINIPAIKTLSYIGIETGKQYAEKLGLEFDERDTSYTLALGGMTYGLTLKDLATAYTVFSNQGNFAPSTFIQYITDGFGKLVYVHKPASQMVFRQDSAYLMTSVLQETAKSGTARKLSDVKNVEVASKTGTVGKGSGNTDAYNITFTPSEVIGVWYGNLKNEPQKIAGGNQPTEVVKNYLSSQSYENCQFEVPSSVVEAKIDVLEEKNNHCLVLASPYAPERYCKTCLFSRFNLPSEVSENFSTPPEIEAECKVENGQIVLSLQTQKHLEYQIFKDDVSYQTLTNQSGEKTLRLPFKDKNCTIKIVATVSGNNELQSEKIFVLQNSTKTKTQKERWYI